MLANGTSFKGYRILQFLGAGGSGAVYRAVQEGLEREVALKMVQVGDQPGSEGRKRFLREARALARLSHPGIIRIYDFGEDGPTLFYSMEYVAGMSLDRELTERGAFTPARALQVMTQLLDALDAVHALGVLHRDIKPANVLVRAEDGVMLSDFGLARERGATRVTREGAMLGTLPYFPPEMCRAAEPDARGDLYQAGVMLYEFLEGKPPYSSEQILTMMKGGRLDPGPALERLGAHLPQAVVTLVERAIEPDPERRFQTASEMNEAVRVAAEAVQAGLAPAARTRLASGAVQAPPVSRPSSRPARVSRGRQVTESAPVLAQPSTGRRPWILAAAGLCWLLALLAMALVALRRPPDAPAPVVAAAPPDAGGTGADPFPISAAPAGLGADVALARARLLSERELPLTVTSPPGADPTVLEVALAACGELEQAELRWESSSSSLAISEINGKQALLRGDRVPLELLRDGNNRFSFAGTLRHPSRTPAVLVIRRGAGASMIVPPAPAGSGPTSAASRLTRSLMEQAKLDYESGRFSEAIKKCEEASRLDPGSWEASWRRAVAVHFLGYLSRGLRASSGLDLLAPTNVDPEVSRLDSFGGFNHALALRPSEGNIWYDLGWAYRDYSRLADAERMLAMSVVLDRPEPRYWWELSRTLAQQVPVGRERDSAKLKLAVRAAVAAFATKGAIKPAWRVERGFLFRRAGLLEEARQDFKTALAREPGNRVARQGLESLPRR